MIEERKERQRERKERRTIDAANCCGCCFVRPIHQGCLYRISEGGLRKVAGFGRKFTTPRRLAAAETTLPPRLTPREGMSSINPRRLMDPRGARRASSYSRWYNKFDNSIIEERRGVARQKDRSDTIGDS
ncbi:hypothetical protein HN011_000514 [Eciton burchellii]|nr:hypothetical protein HN011_000514 [Eciton burchellii]